MITVQPCKICCQLGGERADTKQECESERGGVLEDSGAASSLVCQWAQKLFTQAFPSVQHLARYLVAKSYVNGTSLPAFTVLATAAADSKGGASCPEAKPASVKADVPAKGIIQLNGFI